MWAPIWIFSTHKKFYNQQRLLNRKEAGNHMMLRCLGYTTASGPDSASHPSCHLIKKGSEGNTAGGRRELQGNVKSYNYNTFTHIQKQANKSYSSAKVLIIKHKEPELPKVILAGSLLRKDRKNTYLFFF